jgi:Ca-activated chloride channel family protein
LKIAHNEVVFHIFAYPWVFLGVAALGLFLRRWPKMRPITLPLPTAHLCAGLSSKRHERFLQLLAELGVGAFVMLLLALVGPRWALRSSPSSQGISLALVVDISGSMGTLDFPVDGQKVSRLEGVQRVFRLLVSGGTTAEGLEFPGRPNDLFSLVTFATRPETACPATLDHPALISILDRQEPKKLAGEATTNPGDALAWALAALQKAPTRRKAIIFLTDGDSNVPEPALRPRQAGQLAANLKIPIYAIDALDDEEAGEDAPKAHETLADLARMTGGQHFRATDGAALLQALHELDRLERDAIARPDEAVYRDLTMPFTTLAFAGWLAYLVASIIWGRSVP